MQAIIRRRATILSAMLLLVIVLLMRQAQGTLFTLYQVQSQDMPILLALPALLVLMAFWSPHWRLPNRAPRPAGLMAAGFGIVALLAWGTRMVMMDFPVSRDELMVSFDMMVFAKRHLAMPLAAPWRHFATALVPAFLLNQTMPIGLVSDYLPVNALLRLVFSRIADPDWFNPLLALAGGVALYDIARHAFGPQDRACWVVLLIYALSTQMLVNAMTSYSMTAHMALNLIWLAAFLRGGRSGHGIAVVVGLLAVGLHQIAYHVFFVAPFLLWQFREGRWQLVAGYILAYSAIVLWWTAYPMIASIQAAAVPGQASDANLLTDKVIPLLLNRDPRTATLMTLNLLRFVAWQNLALLPLLGAAIPFAWRDRGFAGSLLLGIVGWLAFVTIILPFQGHGWGYRYLHPYLGSIALLAGFGYRRLATRIGDRADGLVLLLSALTIVFPMPWLLHKTHDFITPEVALDMLIARQRTAFVLIDTEALPSMDGRWTINAIDNVRNRPDLANRPLRFSSQDMKPADLIVLCRRGAVTTMTRRDQQAVGFALNTPTRSPRFDAMIAAAADTVPGCFRDAIRL